jgi:MOSC domain-containing protein YiiM
MTWTTPPVVVAVCRNSQHRFSKPVADEITLLEGLGVEGDAHAGVTVQHRSRVAADPTQPNLRQVHLIHAELHGELREQGFTVEAGQMGENITTRGLDLLALPRGTVLGLGPHAIVEVTGLRNPCNQINDFQPGLLKSVLDKDEQGHLVRKAGIMGIVLRSGPVKPGDAIRVDLPEQPHLPLDRV